MLIVEENMKKTVIALQIASLLYPAVALSAPVKNSTNIKKADETIVVTANRSVQDKFDTLAAVDIFTRDNIEQIQPLSVSDLLTRVAGINITTQGTSAHKSSAFVRGTNSDHILVLVNGVRVGSATLGVKSIADIPVQLVERVEVIRGPRAALWGSDAVGGVIQIFTRELDAGEGQLGFKAGSNSLYQGYGALGFGNDQHRYTISATAEQSDGYDVIVPEPTNIFAVDQPDDDGYDRQSIALNGSSNFGEIYELELNGQFDQGTTEVDANTLYNGDENNYENYHLLIRNHIQLNQVYLQLGLSTSQDSTEDNYSKYNDENGFIAPNNLFATDRNQISALAQLPLADSSEISLGAEWYTESIDSNNAYDETERDASAFFATGRHGINNIKLEGSVRYDKVGDIDSEITYQLAAGYEVNEQLLLSLSHGTAFKAPSFNDLYYPWSGNADLIAESSDTTELLARYQHEVFSAEVAIYQSNIDNLIEWAQVDPNDPYNWKPKNVAQAEILGAEATFTADIFDTSNRLTLSHVDAEDKKSGKQLARRPNFSANYNFVYSLGQLDFTFDVNYQGSRYDNPTAETKELKAYTLLDLGVNYRLNDNVFILAKVTNLTDKNYQQASEYPGAERGYSVTLDYKF